MSSEDSKVLNYLTPAGLVHLMQETGAIQVHDTVVSDGKPVIHAALRKRNALTGEALIGGLTFSVVMHGPQSDKGYTSLALGAVVPLADFGLALPPDFFNFSNQRLRFVRVYPLGTEAFVIQMDIVIRKATREYVKFAFGHWGALYAQILFELIGKGRDGLALAAEAYAAARQPPVMLAPAANDIAGDPPAVAEEAAEEPENLAEPESQIEPEEAPVQLAPASVPPLGSAFGAVTAPEEEEETAKAMSAAADGTEPPLDLK